MFNEVAAARWTSLAKFEAEKNSPQLFSYRGDNNVFASIFNTLQFAFNHANYIF
jgi:hypothetical protein